jgi:hypothetical protein
MQMKKASQKIQLQAKKTSSGRKKQLAEKMKKK